MLKTLLTISVSQRCLVETPKYARRLIDVKGKKRFLRVELASL